MVKARLSLIIVASLMVQFAHSAVLNIQPSTVNAQAWIIYDPQTQQIISEHNSHQRRAPASLTKMMVAYLVLQDIQAGKLTRAQLIKISPIINQVQKDESQLKLTVGETISIDQLLAGLIVMSANDSALVLAEHLGQGNVQNFVARMNETAQKLGMKDTQFANPSGISMNNHYSTAHDLQLLSMALLEQTPDYLHYSKQPYVDYKGQRYPATNLLIGRDNRVDGFKTGYTKDAGYNLALTALQQYAQPEHNRRLVLVVLGTPSIEQRAKVSHQLLGLAFHYTQNATLIPQNTLLARIPLKDANQKYFNFSTEQNVLYTGSLLNQNTPIDLSQFNVANMRLMQKQANGQMVNLEPLSRPNLRYHIQPVSRMTAPIDDKQFPIADAVIYQNDVMVDTKPLTQTVKIEKISLWQRILNLFA